VGRALARLGIEHILGYSPQARGRSERANRTLQDRLVNELRVAGITTVAAANRYVGDRFLPAFNAEFGRPPADPAPAFVPLGRVELDQILCVEDERTVGRDNVVTTDRVPLQLTKQPGRRTCAGLRVLVRRHLSGQHSVCTAAAASVATTRSASRCGRREPMLFNRAANSRCQTVAANSRISNRASLRDVIGINGSRASRAVIESS
jgi:hypothetical protein